MKGRVPMTMKRATPTRRLLLALLAALLPGALALAQDPLAGVTVESLGAASPAAADGQALVFLRITMEPGAQIAAHSHPGSVIVVVDAGEFTTAFTEGEGTLTRYGAQAQPLAPGAEQVLGPGDSLAYDGTAAHTMVNAGSEPLVLLVSALLDPNREGFLFHTTHAGH